MKCKQFVDKICDYIEGNLNDEERAMFESCIESDLCCKRYYDAYVLAMQLGKDVCACKKTNPENPLCDDIIESILSAAKEGK